MLLQVQVPWNYMNYMSVRAATFWRGPDLQWFIHHSVQISGQQNLIQSDELRERLKTFSNDLDTLNFIMWQTIRSYAVTEILERW
jgi:hypothetical protein